MTHTATPTSNVLKFRIKEYLNRRTEAQRLKIKRQIMLQCEINESTLSRYINATIDEQQDIPAYRLRIIAYVLGCEVDELFNESGFFMLMANLSAKQLNG